MAVSLPTAPSLILAHGLAWSMIAAGLLAVFATYWDEAWHTDVGRDSALSAPHVLLYGSVAVVGLGVAVWGVRSLLATRSLRAALTHPPLLSAGIGAATALLAGGIDIVWHAAYGRDAVLWSPPHMLAIFGSVALALGVVNGVDPSAVALRLAGSVLLLANTVAVVFEYEADVPQFTEVLYLPVLLLAALLVAFAVDRLVPRRGAVGLAVAGYAATRLMVSFGLAALGRSTPDLPIAILGLAAWDLPLRSRIERAAAAATAVSWLAWFASATGLASPAADALVVTVLVTSTVLAVVMFRRLSPWAASAAAAITLGGLLVLAPAESASAHDPGQGTDVAPVTMTGDVAGRHITVAATVEEHCDDLAPRRLVARRASQVVTGSLQRSGTGCTFQGDLEVPAEGRWFTYAEFTHDGKTAEAWLPLNAGDDDRVTQTRVLYEPAGGDQAASTSQIVFGASVYLMGAAVVLVALRATRWPVRAKRDT